MSPPAPPRVAVGAVVLDSTPLGVRVLLARRARPPRQGLWSLPGGRVEPGETLRAALEREIKEETSLTVEVGPLVDVVEIIDLPAHYVILDYLCWIRGGELRAGDDASEVTFAPVDDLAAFQLTDEVLRVIQAARSLA